MKESLWRTAR